MKKALPAVKQTPASYLLSSRLSCPLDHTADLWMKKDLLLCSRLFILVYLSITWLSYSSYPLEHTFRPLERKALDLEMGWINFHFSLI